VSAPGTIGNSALRPFGCCAAVKSWLIAPYDVPCPPQSSSVEQYGDGSDSRRPWLHDEVHFPRHKREDDFAAALLEFHVLTVGVPVSLQPDRARFASLGTDVGLARDASVGRLSRFREYRRQFRRRWQLTRRLGRNQQPADLALDFVVAAFSDPFAHEPSSIVEEVFRWPRIVPQGAPDGEVIVDRNWIAQFMVANAPVDVVGLLAKLELRSVHSDDDQPEWRVDAMPRLDVRSRPNPVDARVLPKINEDDLAAQRLRSERR